MSDILAFQANNNKRLVVAIKTESVYAQTEWTDCQNPKSGYSSSFILPTISSLIIIVDFENFAFFFFFFSIAQDEENPETEPPDPTHMFTVLISTRSFLKFLNSHVVSTTTIACMFSVSFELHRADLKCSPFFLRTILRYLPASLCHSLRIHRGYDRCWRGVDVLYPCDYR